MRYSGRRRSGKTTLTCSIVAQAQRLGGVAAFIDAEHALDLGYARKIGVDVDNILISQPDTGEQALDIAEVLVRSSAIDIVVVDSVAALVPAAEIEGEMGDSHVGLQARLMSQALRKLAGAVSKSKTCLIFTNQIRMKIGVLYGNPETTTGGNALKFYATVRLDIRRIGQITDGDTVIGNQTRVKVVKNKVAPPSARRSSRSSSGKGSASRGISSSSVSPRTSLRRREAGTLSARSGSVRARTTPGCSSKKTRTFGRRSRRAFALITGFRFRRLERSSNVASEREYVDTITRSRRRWGKLHTVTTSSGRSFLVLKGPASERFLAEGTVLDRGALEELAGPLARAAGMAFAYRLLAVRDRSEHEIRGALGKEGILTPEVVDGIVDALRRQGYLDDRRLASLFVNETARRRPGGPHLIRRKLREAGVSEEIIEHELREALPPEREREVAETLARKKLRGAKTREQAVRRIHGLLARRGFNERVINAICSSILRGTFPGERDDA